MNLAEEQKLVEAYYQRAVAGAKSDEEELKIVQHLLEEARKGAVPADDGQRLVRIDLSYELPVDAGFLLDKPTTGERLRKALPLAGAIVAGLVLVLLAYGDWGKSDPTPTPTTTYDVASLATATLTPTPTPPVTPSVTPLPSSTPGRVPTRTPTATSLPTMTATPAEPKEVEVKPEPVELDAEAVIPVSLEMGGRYFPVVPTTLRGNAWAYVLDPGQVSWLAGSYVNVVLGLPYTRDNLNLVATALVLDTTSTLSDTHVSSPTRAVSDTLAPASLLVLRDNVGGTAYYRVVDRYSVSVYETEALGQRRVGLTLVLLGGNEEDANKRLVIHALPAEEQEVATAPD